MRSSLRQVRRRRTEAGRPARPPTVGRLLGGLGDALHRTATQVEASAAQPERDAKVHGHRGAAAAGPGGRAAGQPIISVDTTKQEQERVGAGPNAGRAWGRRGAAVNVADVRQDGLGRAVPSGRDDLTPNRGTGDVGVSADTARFAVEVRVRWWQTAGQAAGPGADRLLVLADAGGRTGCRPRLWQHQLPEQVSDGRGLTVTGCHDPTGCSPWRPIAHRLGGPISRTWAGQPLRTWAGMLGYRRGTTTTTGLPVGADLQDGGYRTGARGADAPLASRNLERHAVWPAWNDTIRPRPRPIRAATGIPADRGLVA